MAQPITTPPPPPAKQAVVWKRWEIICLMRKEIEQMSKDTCYGLTFDSSWVKMKFLIDEMEKTNACS